jgi:hypothetical protein
MSDQINDPEPYVETLLCVYLIMQKGGFGENVYLSEQEAECYRADPDLFAARHFGFASIDEYREWVAASNSALCSERTRNGKLCGNSIGMTFRPEEWRAQHRSHPCWVHGWRS